MIKLTKAVSAAILAAAAATADEICGVVLRIGRRQVWRRLDNVSDRPSETFEIRPDDWLSAEADGEILAVVHSHPGGLPYLSADDRALQVHTDLPWVLAVGGRLRVYRCCAPLRGREFDYGKADCFSLLRDAYHLAGIDFRDHERGTLAADAAADSFVQNLPDGGFYRVADDSLQPGDVLLTAMGGTADHVLLYLGEGMMVHHAAGHLSRCQPFGGFWQHHLHSVWRHRDWQPEMIGAVRADLDLAVGAL